MLTSNPFIVDAQTATAIVSTPINDSSLEDKVMVIGVPPTSANLAALIASTSAVRFHQIKVDLSKGYFVFKDYDKAKQLIEDEWSEHISKMLFKLSPQGQEHLKRNPSGIIFTKIPQLNAHVLWLLNPKETITEIKDLTPQIKTTPNALKV